MTAFEMLLDGDKNLFLAINGTNAPFFDALMFAISAKLTWAAFYLSVLYVVIKYWRREAVWIVLALVLCVVFSDQVASSLIKNWVQRLRPSHEADLNGLVHLVRQYSGGTYGFVSSHAANAFGFALLSSLVLKQRIYTFVVFLWAVLIAYSRIYLGVHYPLDILGGALVGMTGALIFFLIIKKLRPSLLEAQYDFSDRVHPNVIISILALGLTYFGILLYSIFVF